MASKGETCTIFDRSDYVTSESSRFHVGFSQTQGRRDNMEDAILVKGNFRNNHAEDLYAVFDGFRGAHVARFAVENLPLLLAAELNEADLELSRKKQRNEDNHHDNASDTESTDSHDHDSHLSFEGLDSHNPSTPPRPSPLDVRGSHSNSRSQHQARTPFDADDYAPRSPSIAIRSMPSGADEHSHSFGRQQSHMGFHSMSPAMRASSLSKSPFQRGIFMTRKSNIADTIGKDYERFGSSFMVRGDNSSIVSSLIPRRTQQAPSASEVESFYATVDHLAFEDDHNHQQDHANAEHAPLQMTLYALAIRRAFWMLQEKITQNFDDGGSTALVFYRHGDLLLVANVGDTRAILRRKGERYPFRLSKDHKPNDDTERARIERKGGMVSTVCGSIPRVQGELAVSRAFGMCQRDFVIPEPHIHGRILHEKDEFFLLATDGLWDKLHDTSVSMMGNSTLMKATKDSIEDDVFQACNALVSESYAKNSNDNISGLSLSQPYPVLHEFLM
eukprot:TRINITY_DN1628_c0_g1_i5.p1 TRINITY_DN1628_c0_g1~~TRINITY_DN1628_c0_g1_i5.p1  ORF type:complete len:503 (+),score=89.60 TRINITY_DN1628_c0_g1_i5:701-2209(+)